MAIDDRGHVHQGRGLVTAGAPLDQARHALILVHGRGATAESIISLGEYFDLQDTAFLAPQAAYNRWYPETFLAPVVQNEPDLSSALIVLNELVLQIENAGIPTREIWLAGFSQGACLIAEFVSRLPRRYGGLLLFSGGVIGPLSESRQAHGDLDKMPVFIGCSTDDPHIPLQRVNETASLFSGMNAAVHLRIYPGMGHTITQEELEDAQVVFNEKI